MSKLYTFNSEKATRHKGVLERRVGLCLLNLIQMKKKCRESVPSYIWHCAAFSALRMHFRMLYGVKNVQLCQDWSPETF